MGSYLKSTKKKNYTGREPGNKSKIYKDDLKEVYEKTKSSRKAAEIFGVSKTTILNFLREYDISICKEPVKGREPRNKVKIAKRDLESAYTETKSVYKVAQKFGVSKTTILRKLKQHGISIGKNSGRPKMKDNRHTQHKKRYPVRIVNGRRIALHRYIMEKEIGRELKTEETVHHIDMNTSNNTIENLYLFKNESKHMIAHHSAWKLMEELFKGDIIGFKEEGYYIIKNQNQ